MQNLHPSPFLVHSCLLLTIKVTLNEALPCPREAVARWVGEIPREVLRDSTAWAPALRAFGYPLFQ